MSQTDAKQREDFRVVVLSGPSGSGKTSLVRRLIEQAPVKLRKAVSATTRPPRPDEIEGQSYYFLSPEEFERRLQNGQFVEWAEVFKTGHRYGTLKSELDRAAELGAWPVLEIDVRGAMQIVEKYPHAITIFLKTPSEAEYERRLRCRATESEEFLQRRLARAREEVKMADRYQYQVVNDRLDRAVQEICHILASQEAERHAG